MSTAEMLKAIEAVLADVRSAEARLVALRESIVAGEYEAQQIADDAAETEVA